MGRLGACVVGNNDGLYLLVVERRSVKSKERLSTLATDGRLGGGSAPRRFAESPRVVDGNIYRLVSVKRE